jgi:hypothetical protein
MGHLMAEDWGPYVVKLFHMLAPWPHTYLSDHSEPEMGFLWHSQ